MRTAAILSIALAGCSNPTSVTGPEALLGTWEAARWTLINSSDRAETIDALRFFEDWELTLGADSSFAATYRVVSQFGIVSEIGDFSRTGAVVEFLTAGPIGQVSISGRSFDYEVTGDTLRLGGASTLGFGIGQTLGFTPRVPQFLDYTIDNEIVLLRR